MVSSENRGHHTRFVFDSQSDKSFWDVLVLDDDQVVHEITARTLADLSFSGRRIRCIHAHTCRQAKDILTSHPKTALLLLDIAVETDTDGLDLIHWIRRTQENSTLQIAVRTGKTEIFTEEDIVDGYDINDFLSKTDATYLRLKILVKKAIRTHKIQRALETELAHRSSMEAELQQKETQLRDLIENIGDMVWQIDGQWHFTFISGQAVTGYTATEMMGRPYEFTMTDECLQGQWPELRGLMDRSERFSNVEIARVHKNGSVRHYLTSGSPLRTGERAGYRGAEKDITDLVNAENEKKALIAQLRNAQRLEAIGTLAGGIAHDFNNILGGIMGYAQLLQFDIKENPNALSYVNYILSGCNRAKNLILQILEFSRQRERSRPDKLTDPVRIVNETMKLFRATLPSSIHLDAKIDSDIGWIRADPSQIHQAVMNLCTNASHAIETAMGEIIIRVKVLELTPENHTRSPALDIDHGEYITIAVQDTGKGIEKDVVEQIFNPYFTTKNRGDGTGLGLSVVHGIVTRFNGIVTCNTWPGRGSVFTLYFPRYRRQEAPSPRENTPSISHSKARIMFIDDEPMLVDIGRMMLEKMGFHVMATQDPMAGLEAIRREPDLYDIVITDMTMPQIHGSKLAVKIKEINPKITIILATGFSNIVQTQKATPAGIDAVLPKPISMNSLSRTLHELRPK